METIKLINGKFTPEEAKEILLDLIAKKINFHNLKNFSSEVCYSQPDAESRKRIKELQEAKAQVLTLVREAKEEQSHLVIESTIRIAFADKGQVIELCSEAESY